MRGPGSRTAGRSAGPVRAAFVLAAIVIAVAWSGDAGAQAPIDADLAVTVVGSPAVAKVGDQVTFIVTVVNNGPDDVPLTHLTDTPPPLTGLSWTCTSAGGVTCPVSGGTGPIDLTTAFPTNGTMTVTITGIVSSVPPAGRIANQASMTSQAPGFLDSDPSNNFSQAAVPVADLQVVKSAAPTNIQLGSVVSYTLTITNPGLGNFIGATVVDDLSQVLDDATYDNDALATTGSVAFATPDLTWTGTLPGRSTVTVTYSVSVNDPATGDGVLTNAVSANGGNCTTPTDPSCSTEVTTPPTTTTPISPTTTTPTSPAPTSPTTAPAASTSVAPTVSSGPPAATSPSTPAATDPTRPPVLPATGRSIRTIVGGSVLAVLLGGILARARRIRSH